MEGNPIPAPRLFGIDLAVRHGTDLARLPFGILVLVALVLVSLAVANLARGASGRAFLAVRSNERAASAAGIDVARTKLVAFVISSSIAGLGGALIGYCRGQLPVDSFTVIVGLALLAFAYLGGITSIGGAITAGLLAPLGVIYVLSDRLIDAGEYYLLLSGVGLVLTAIFNPSGIAGKMRDDLIRLRNWRRARRREGSAEALQTRVDTVVTGVS